MTAPQITITAHEARAVAEFVRRCVGGGAEEKVTLTPQGLSGGLYIANGLSSWEVTGAGTVFDDNGEVVDV